MSAHYRSESWLHPDLFVGPSPIDGRGVFCRSDLSRGDTIIVWGGTLFTREDIDAGRAKDHTMVAVEEGCFLGSTPSAELSIDDYMNHSCAANVGMADPVTLVVRHDVPAGTELTADYSTWLDNPEYIMKRACNCGAPSCRRVITGGDWQRADVQAVNRGYFSPFLRRRIRAMNFSGDRTMDILVTGGSRGIGNAIAKELVAAGHRLLIIGRDGSTLESARNSLSHSAKAPTLAFQCDVARAEDRSRLTSYCCDVAFAPEVLVLNAGIFIEGDLLTSPEQSFATTMGVNLDASFHLVQAFAPAMVSAGRGRIILIGSTAAYEPYPVGALYGVSKWALRGYAANLRRELMHKGVGVTFVAPGGTWTDLWAGEELPADRLMLPSDVARLVRAILELSPQAVVEEIIFRPMLGDIHE